MIETYDIEVGGKNIHCYAFKKDYFMISIEVERDNPDDKNNTYCKAGYVSFYDFEQANLKLKLNGYPELSEKDKKEILKIRELNMEFDIKG